MKQDIARLLIPVILLLMLPPLHFIVSRIFRNFSVEKSLKITFLSLTFLFLASYAWILILRPQFTTQTLWGGFANAIVLLSGSYAYLLFRGTSGFMVKSRLLCLISGSGQGLTIGEIRYQLSKDEVTDQCLKNLEETGQLVLTKNRWRRSHNFLTRWTLLILLGGGVGGTAFFLIFDPSFWHGVWGLLIFWSALLLRQKLSSQSQIFSNATSLAACTGWGLFLAFLVMLVRVTLGYTILPAWSQGEIDLIPTWTYNAEFLRPYDKSEIRMVLLHFVCLLGILAGVISCADRFLKSELNKTMIRDPLWPLALLCIVVACVIPPNMHIDAYHWSTWIGPAHAINKGMWPIFHSQFMYGFLNLASLALLMGMFKLTPFLLVFWTYFFTVASSVIVYKILKKISRSSMAAFLVTVTLCTIYCQPENSVAVPNHGEARWIFPYVSSVFLFYTSLFIRCPKKLALNGFLFALVCLWEPTVGLFMAFGYLIAHTGLFWSSRKLQKLTGVLAAFITGCLVLLAVIVLGAGGPEAALEGLKKSTEIHSLFSSGFGARRQDIRHSDFLLLGVLLSSLFFILRGMQKPRFSLSASGWLSIYSFLVSIPALLYCLVSSENDLRYHFIWLIAPSLLLTARILVKTMKHQTGKILAGALLLGAFIPDFFQIPKIIENRLFVNYIGKHEAKRIDFYQKCLNAGGKGNACLSETKSSIWLGLQDSLRQEIPLPGRVINPGNSKHLKMLIGACKANIPILSTMDAWIYAFGDCTPPHRYSSYVMASSRSARTDLFNILSDHPVVFLNRDPFNHSYNNYFITANINSLRGRGYMLKEHCHDIDVYVRGNPGYFPEYCKS